MGPTNGVNVATMPKTFVSKTARNADRSSGCDVNVPRDTPALATTTSGAPKRAMKSAAARASLGGPGGVQIGMFGARSKADWVVKHLAVDHGLVSELRFSGLDPR